MFNELLQLFCCKHFNRKVEPEKTINKNNNDFKKINGWRFFLTRNWLFCKTSVFVFLEVFTKNGFSLRDKLVL